MSARSTPPLTAEAFAPPAAELSRLQGPALVAAGIGVLGCILGAIFDSTQFFRSYLVAFALWFGIAVGCLAIDMLHHMTHGTWGLMIRRNLEAGSRTVPFAALLFTPLLFGLPALYSWARPAEVAASETLQHKAPYLNEPFFIGRLVVYFVAFSAIAWAINGISARQDRTGDARLDRRFQVVSAPGLLVYGLLISFAAVDWFMSLSPDFYSTIYGFYFIIGEAVSALGFVILVASFLADREPMSQVLEPRHFHDYGKLLLAFTMVWAYFVVSQLIIIWSGNLPEEISFYLDRIRGGWLWYGIFLAVFHFFVPFALLLSRDLKRNRRRLAGVAALLLVVHWFDLYWLAAPNFYDHLRFHWLDLAAMLAVGGIWLWLYLWQLKKRPLLPIGDPFLAEALDHE